MTHDSTATKLAPTPKMVRVAKPLRKPKGSHALRGGTPEANRLAVAILEVLAGIRTPTEAAHNVGLSLVRYFQLETRALQGLVQALEPRPNGKQPSLEGRLKQLEKQLQQARRDCVRQQALVRVAQRSVGLPVSSAASAKATPTRESVGRKKRRPIVRALKAARALQARSRQQQAELPADHGAAQTPSPLPLPKNDRQEEACAVETQPAPTGARPQDTQEVKVVSD